jgi:hypothetical protein
LPKIFPIILCCIENNYYLCPRNKNKKKIMLGIDTPHKPVEGKFAEEIRDAVRRVTSKKLNDADKRRLRRSRRVLARFDAVWE